MAQDDQGKAPDAEAVEAGRYWTWVRPRIDEDRPTRLGGGQYDGITLADVAGHHYPARRRPTGRHEPRRHQHKQGAHQPSSCKNSQPVRSHGKQSHRDDQCEQHVPASLLDAPHAEGPKGLTLGWSGGMSHKLDLAEAR